MKKFRLFGDLDDLGRKFFLKAVEEPRVIACSQGVVTYTIAQVNGPTHVGAVLQHVFNPQEMDAKVKEILAITPNLSLAKLRKIGQDLGITVHSFEKVRPAEPLSGDDVIF